MKLKDLDRLNPQDKFTNNKSKKIRISFRITTSLQKYKLQVQLYLDLIYLQANANCSLKLSLWFNLLTFHQSMVLDTSSAMVHMVFCSMIQQRLLRIQIYFTLTTLRDISLLGLRSQVRMKMLKTQYHNTTYTNIRRISTRRSYCFNILRATLMAIRSLNPLSFLLAKRKPLLVLHKNFHSHILRNGNELAKQSCSVTAIKSFKLCSRINLN